MKIHDFPASSAQEYMWLAVQLDANRPSYNVPYRIRLAGEPRPDALRGAVNHVVARHESLRTSFRYRDGELRQLVRAQLDIDVPLVDLCGHPDADERAADLAQRAATGLFDLERGPLVRAVLLRPAPDQHQLILVMHHLVFDGWSTGVLMDELARAYAAYVAGREPNLPALPIQYADFSRWQREQLASGELESSIEYWRRQLRGAQQVHLAAAGREHSAGRPSADTAGADAFHPLRLPQAVDEAVRELAAAERCTPFVVMLTAFAVLLAAHAGGPEILVGTPAANRPRPETADLIGLFVNMIVVRADLRGAPSYRELLGRIQATVLAGFDAQVPFERVVAELQPQRHGRSPFFQATFSHQSAPAAPPRIGELRTELDEMFTGAAKYDLALGVRPSPGGSTCQFSYATSAFDAGTVQRLAERYLAVLESMTADPGRRPDQAAALRSWRDEAMLVPIERDPVPDHDSEPAGADGRQLQRTIAEVWRAVLDVEQVGPNDNFFELGGHSRLMVEVRERLAQLVGRKLTLLDLFEYPTIAALAGFLAGGDDRPAADPGTVAAAEKVAEQQRAARLRVRQTRGNA